MAGLDAEVAVVGVGTMGSMALWQLARRGVPAVGFERYNPGHDRSGAGGESRLFRTAYHEGSHYVPLLRHARTLWRELEAETGHPLLTLNGGLMIGGADSPFLTSVRRSVADHGIDHEVLDRDGMARRYPQHPLREGELAVLDRESGFLRPELAVTVAADAAERRGATIVRHRRVTRIEPDGDGVTVLAGDERWRVRTAIVAAGAWTNALLPGHTPRLDVQRLIMTGSRPATRPGSRSARSPSSCARPGPTTSRAGRAWTAPPSRWPSTTAGTGWPTRTGWTAPWPTS